MEVDKGKKELPDFKELDDRLIAEPSQGPFFEIKTNLDTPVTEDNPYISSETSNEEIEKIKRFFDDDVY
ncbi:hypothetical protein BHE18_11515 [Rossellomorea aquimaris]|uniref:Uncharacterized protein n=1 Tax=Rossellomorea aquimaris TaxID=189382 RepID=A0A1J6VYF0_9BACI|nr:hypothetical protein BHE18_11515 [Rossellomorea aquimaris]